jgi:dTDP-L-rhamnose 4-epimerase
MSRTLLITGGAGFIGTRAYKDLIEDFEKIVIVDNFAKDVHPNGNGFKLLRTQDCILEVDVCNLSDLLGVIETHNPTDVLHLAAETATGKSLKQPIKHASTNTLGTASLLEALATMPHNVSTFVLTSTRAIYGEGAWTNIQTGQTFQPGQRKPADLEAAVWDVPNSKPEAMDSRFVWPNPANIYGVTKNAQEQMARVWCESNDVSFVALRLQNVYGPGQTIGNPYTGVLTHFTNIASEGRDLEVFEDGLILRDFVFVSDVVVAIRKAFKAANKKMRSDVIDIGSGEPETLFKVASMIAAEFSGVSAKVTGKFRLGDVRHAFADISQASALLTWSPEVPLREGVRLLCRHVADSKNQ